MNERISYESRENSRITKEASEKGYLPNNPYRLTSSFSEHSPRLFQAVQNVLYFEYRNGVRATLDLQGITLETPFETLKDKLAQKLNLPEDFSVLIIDTGKILESMSDIFYFLRKNPPGETLYVMPIQIQNGREPEYILLEI